MNFIDPEFVRVVGNKAHPLHGAAMEFYLHLALNHEVGRVRASFLCARSCLVSRSAGMLSESVRGPMPNHEAPGLFFKLCCFTSA